MKIISKFKDYYDSVSHKYLDKEVKYLRNTVSHVIKDYGLPDIYRSTSGFSGRGFQGSYTVSTEIVGFCGVLYPVVYLHYRTTTYGYVETKEAEQCFYNEKDLVKFIKEHNIPIEEGSLKRRWYYGVSLARLRHFFVNRDNYENLEKMFLKYKSPYFVFRMAVQGRDHMLVTDPVLKDYSFFKVKDNFSAHQEIYRYITSVLPQPERPMVKISDEDKIHKHGFNKWSFRKTPTKRKGGK